MIFISLCAYAQNDSLVFKNGNIIVGELKSMDRGVVVVSTDYSDSDFTLDTKYDLPDDFYIKIGFTINYDNKPAQGESETDYVFQTGFGWEW